MSKSLAVFFLFLVSAKWVAAQEGIRLVESNENSATIELTPRWLPETTLEIDGKRFITANFLGGVSSRGEAGLPDMKRASAPIIVGSTKAPRVEILSSESKALLDVGLAPVPTVDSLGNFTYIVSDKYASAPLPKLVEARLPETQRGYLISQIHFSPIQYNPTTRTLRQFTKIVARISFEPFKASKPLFLRGQAATQASSLKADNLMSGALNFQTAKSWTNPVLRDASMDTVTQSALRSGRWFKLEIKEEGLYRLDRAYLESIGIDVGSLNPRKIKVYFNGGAELNTRVNAIKIPDLQECAIQVQGESDGRFDNGDEVLFYAKTTQGLKFDATTNRLAHYNHQMSNSAFAFLAIEGEDGKRIGQKSTESTVSPIVPSSFLTQSFIETDRVHFTNFGISFYDAPLNSSRRSATYSLPSPSMDASKPISVRSLMAAANTQFESFSLNYDGQKLAEANVGVTVSTYTKCAVFTLNALNVTTSPAAQIPLRLDFSGNGGGSALYLDWIEVDFWKRFEAQNNFLLFNSQVGVSAPATVEYRLTGFNATPTVWDVTDLNNISSITGVSSNATVQLAETPNVYREYVAFTQSAPFKRPASATSVANQNIRSLAQAGSNPEYIIVYPKEFETEARRLLDYRTNAARWGALALKGAMVSTEQIYNEFSCGKQDYAAIRNFIKFLYDNAPSFEARPKYVLLFGDGDWDYRSLASASYPKVPAFASAGRTDELEPNNVTDEFFVSVDGEGFNPDLTVGRLTAQSSSQARQMVDKIIQYETASDKGDWRNRIAFVADDGVNGNEGFDGARFADESDDILNFIRDSAPYMNSVKIYSAFFRAETIAGGRRRPGAFDEIVRQINSGVSVVNFIGHGNPNVWTAERIFEPPTTYRLLNNPNRLAFFITTTCDFGRLDDPSFQSGAEQLLALPSAGAVALYSTSRSITIVSGSVYSPFLCQDLFTRDNPSLPPTVGESLFKFKLRFGNNGDASFFNLLGDPALRLLTGRTVAKIDSVNGRAFSQQNITIPALSRTAISGSIRATDSASTLLTAFNGKADVVIYDAPRRTAADHDGDGVTDDFYDVRNAIVYRGTVDVRNGRFSVNFIVPKDIAYDSAKVGRVSVYAWKEGENLGDIYATASGASEQVVFAGTNPTVQPDNTPPLAQIYLNDESFTSGGITNQNPLFIAKLSDENGINLAQSIGRALTLVLNGDEQNPITLNDFYQAKEGSFTDGEIRYQLRDLRDGRYSLRFKAFDTFNNSVEQFLDFTVADSAKLALGNRVMNYPNPFRDRTTFVIENNRPDDALDVQIKIYTVAGRLIKTLRESQSAHRINIAWDGKDEDGSDLANGIYLYKVTLSSQSGNFRAERIEKLAIVR